MPPASVSSDYRPALRLAIAWATLNSTVGTLLAAPLLVLACAFAIGQLHPEIAVGAVLGVLAVASLAASFLFGVVRCSILSVRAVRARPGYPDRHWKAARRALGITLRVEFVAMAVASASTALAIFGRGRFAETIPPVAAVVDAISVVLLILSVFGIDDLLRRSSVVPYFPSRVGEIETFIAGEILARHVVGLDEMAGPLGLAALSSFGWNDDLAGEPLVWHESRAGLATVEGLLDGLKADPPAWDDLAGVISDLDAIARALARAEGRGIPFSLLLRDSSATSSLEWEARKGTCF